jgi:putative colanic acid biosynthesis UDP-glucose lipid carrier transferase
MSSLAGSCIDRRVRLGSIEPAGVVLLKQCEPALAMLLLFLCEFVFHDQFTPALGAYSTLAFILVRQLFSLIDIRGTEHAYSTFSRPYCRIFLQWACVIAILLFVAYAFKVSADLSRKVMLTWFAVTPLALSGSHALRRHLNWFAVNGARAPRHIIVGVNELGFELARRLPPKGFMGYFDFRSSERLAGMAERAKLTGHCKDVADFVRLHGVSHVYIALPLRNVPRMNELVNALRDTTASIYFIPDAFAFDLIQGRLVEINGMPALSVCDTPFHGMDAVLKRATDLVFAVLGLIVTGPLMLAIALAIKLTSKGPVFYRQRRYGLNGEEMLVYKFRSMTTGEDGAVVTQASRAPPRVTLVGRFVRKTSLDELPQLLNVLEGKMSLVGPRPHAVAHNEMYRKLISGYMIRHKVRPGITGLDAKIILKTIGLVLRGSKNATDSAAGGDKSLI